MVSFLLYYRYQFKIDSMTTLGPSLVGAFASKDKHDAMQLHTLLQAMMQRSPLNRSLLKLSNRSTRSSIEQGEYLHWQVSRWMDYLCISLFRYRHKVFREYEIFFGPELCFVPQKW